MPYEIVKIGDKHVLRNKKTKRVLGKHPSRAAAIKQLQAVEINSTEHGNRIVEGLALDSASPSNHVQPGVLIRNDDGNLETVSPHQARKLFFSSANLEHGRRTEVRRTKLS